MQGKPHHNFPGKGRKMVYYVNFTARGSEVWNSLSGLSGSQSGSGSAKQTHTQCFGPKLSQKPWDTGLEKNKTHLPLLLSVRLGLGLATYRLEDLL